MRRIAYIVLVWTVSAGAGVAGAPPAGAGVVDVITVTSDADDGPGSLRAAVAEASGTPGEDRIVFAIPGPAPHVIHLATPIVVNTSIAVDGTTQPGWDGEPVVTLDGGGTSRLVDVARASEPR